MSEHGRGRRDALIAAAYRRIATEGFEGRRTRDVAADVGGNIATLHYYFPTKQELIRSVVGQAMQPFQATLPADGSPVDQLREHLGALARLLKEDQELWSVMGELVLRAPRDANLAQIFRQTDAYWHRALRDLIARAADHGTTAPSVDPDDTAALMIAAIKGLSLPTVTGFQPAVADQVFRQLSDCSARPCSIHNQEDATMSAISPVSPARSHAPPSGAMHLLTRL